MKPRFDGNSVEDFGYNEEGLRLLLTEDKYIWVVDADGCITYDGELYKIPA